MKEYIWLNKASIFVSHELTIQRHGGASGFRALALLESAICNPINSYLYAKPDVFELAAIYASSLVKNHPFIDGNKRVAFISMILFLKINHCNLILDDKEAVLHMIKLASGEIDSSELAQWMRRSAENTPQLPERRVINPPLMIWRKAGIVYGKHTSKVECTLSVAKKAAKMIEAVSDGKKLPCICDISYSNYITKEARNFLVSEEYESLFTSMAVVSKSPLGRMLGNFFIYFSKPRKPTRLFDSVAKAEEWSFQYRKLEMEASNPDSQK